MVYVSDGKIIVKDEEENWITVNGAHVLVGENGQVKAGAGGNLNGTKESSKGENKQPFKVGNTYAELKSQWHEIENQKKKSTNAEEIDKLENLQMKIDRKIVLKNIWHDLDKKKKQSNNAEEIDRLENEQMDIDKRIESIK